MGWKIIFAPQALEELEQIVRFIAQDNPAAWADAFEVDFEDGLTFREPHETIRKANRISPDAKPVRVELDEEPCIGFFVRYDNGQTAEVSWAFVRELPPKSSQK